MANTSDALACHLVSLSLDMSHSHILKERKERRKGGRQEREGRMKVERKEKREKTLHKNNLAKTNYLLLLHLYPCELVDSNVHLEA